MSESTVFSFDRFLSLTGAEFVNYVEPFVNAQSGSIPEGVYDPLQARLSSMDAEHAVYALEICMRLNAGEFVRRAAVFLSHSDAAVCCAAYRVINWLPVTSMPPDVAAEIAATPAVDLFGPDFRSGERIRIGTNEAFIRDLVTKFVPRPGAGM